MIMTRTPFRVSLGGGGSDLKEFYSKNGRGAVLSTTIDKYMYVMIHNYFHEKIRIKYSKTEDVTSLEEIQHPIVRECLKMAEIRSGMEIASIADVPAGTGMGSSSAFTVCLLHALKAFKNKPALREELAEKACHIEIDILQEPIGKQDQYATSFGGLNFIEFHADGSVRVEPVKSDPDVIHALEQNLMLFYVGNDRKASGILSEQRSNMDRDKEFSVVKAMVEIAGQMRLAIEKGDLKRFAGLLHQSWLLKKQASAKISNAEIDRFYETGLQSGALGGKLLGAGGGGFLLFYCETEHQPNLQKNLNLKRLNFRFETGGSQIVYTE